MGMGTTPIFVLKEGTERKEGKDAQESNVRAAIAVADAVKSSLGPRGMDKMLVDRMGDVVITNDGVTILEQMDIEHPAAKMLVEVAKAQDEECGDGTTTAVILAGELLRKASELVESNVHPTVVAEGYRKAAGRAVEELEDISIPVEPIEDERLKQVAMTAIVSKTVSGQKEHLAKLSVQTAKTIGEGENGRYRVDLDNVQMVKKPGGHVGDTELVRGIIIDKEPVHPQMPRMMDKARIALLDAALEVRKTETDAEIEIKDPATMQQFLEQEENMLQETVEKIIDTGANVLFCQKGIDDLAQHLLAKSGLLALRRVKKSDMEKLARATGGSIVNNVEDLESHDLGKADKVEVRRLQEDEMTFVEGCENPKAVSILIRGGTQHVVEECERSLIDSLSVVANTLEDGKLLAGGGSPAIELALRLRDSVSSVGGREQIAIDSFAQSLEVIPTTLAENAGLDPIDILVTLREEHKKGNVHHGINVQKGEVRNMPEDGVLDPARVVRQAIESATDAAVMIIRIDDLIASKGSEGGEGPPVGPDGTPGAGAPPDLGDEIFPQ